jgi:hypothetical protein
VITDEVRVVLRETDGPWLATCPYIPELAAQADEARMAAYPNPVAAGGAIRLRESALADEELEERYATFYLFDVQGKLVNTGKASALRNGLAMPELSGMYYLILEGKAGKMQLKVVVGE